MEIVRNHCIAADPAPFLAEFGTDPTVGPLMRALGQSCANFLNYLRTLGLPADTPGWRTAAATVARDLEPVVEAERKR